MSTVNHNVLWRQRKRQRQPQRHSQRKVNANQKANFNTNAQANPKSIPTNNDAHHNGNNPDINVNGNAAIDANGAGRLWRKHWLVLDDSNCYEVIVSIMHAVGVRRIFENL